MHVRQTIHVKILEPVCLTRLVHLYAVTVIQTGGLALRVNKLVCHNDLLHVMSVSESK